MHEFHGQLSKTNSVIGKSSRAPAEPATRTNYHECVTEYEQEKLNEAIMLLNRNLQEINIQNMNVELVAQMFKNYQSNVLFHLEATDSLKEPS
ncbi:DASH complex subunit dad4 protein [Rutstroemia sp. NJR-2017a WRK4]|nr:DASH complex subunit dad4 protein [Rutstroemia sp. NJR-2017a WRK4]